MIHSLILTKKIAEFQDIIQQQNPGFELQCKSIFQQISQLIKELDRDFTEFNKPQETVAIYDLYYQLVTLKQQIKLERSN